MKNFLKKYTLLSTSIIIIVVMLVCFTCAPQANAQSYFGGRNTFMVPCTCSVVTQYRPFIPLYFSGVAIAGALVTSLVPFAFAHYYLVPGASALGHYAQGAGACYIGVYPYCTYLPNYGLIIPTTGASL